MVFVTVGLQVVSWEIGERSSGRIQLVNILSSKNVHAQSLWSLERRSLKGETRELESVTCPGSAHRIGRQSPGQHGAAAAPALALTPACVGHQLSLPCVRNTSCGRRCQILSMLLASQEHLPGQVQEAPGGWRGQGDPTLVLKRLPGSSCRWEVWWCSKRSVLRALGLEDFPGGSVVKGPPATQEPQETWVWSLGQEDPRRTTRQPSPVVLPGEFHGQRSLVDYLYRVAKSQTQLKQLSMHKHPGGSVVKNLPANTGDMGSIPGPGGFRMLQSDWAH